MKVFWFFPTHGDGHYLGASVGGRPITPAYLRQITLAIDELGQALKTTADFLVEQQVIREAPELPIFQAGANPSYLQLAAGK